MFWLTKRHLNRELWEAAQQGQVAEVRRLLDVGADVNAVQYHVTVLGKAGRSPHGNVETVRLLLERGAWVNGDPHGKAVHSFALAAHLSLNEIIWAFIEYGADVNTPAQKPGTGWTALQELIGWANADTIRLMIERGADVTMRSINGNTALHKAASMPRPDIVALLLEHGADISLLNDAGESALDTCRKELQRHGLQRNRNEQQEQVYREVIALLNGGTR